MNTIKEINKANKTQLINFIVSQDDKANIEGKTVKQLKHMATAFIADDYTIALANSRTVNPADYDNAISNELGGVKQLAEFTRLLLQPVYIARLEGRPDEDMAKAFEQSKAIAEKISFYHRSDKETMHVHMSKYRTNLSRGLKYYNAKLEEAGHKDKVIEERIAVKAVKGTDGKAYSVGFAKANAPKKPEAGADIVKGTAVEIVIPEGVSFDEKCMYIMKALINQTNIFDDAEGNKATVREATDQLSFAIDAMHV